MNRIAFIFPGQGAQSPGMGKAMHDAFPAVRDIFDVASAGLGRDVRQMCWDTDAATLSDTANAQPGLLAASTACLQPLLAAGIRPDVLAGLSLGEYTALVAAGSIDLASAMALVDLRARLMQQAVPKGEGAMAAVIGLDRAGVLAACAAGASLGIVEPANYNAPDQIVISGHTAAVAAAAAAARTAGAKRVIPLAVSAPFHCSLLNVVGPEFGRALDGADFRAPAVTVVANTTARPVGSADEVRAALLNQIASAVLWEDSVRYMYEQMGIRTFVEIGPGKVLSRFVSRTYPDATTLNVEDPATLAATISALRESVSGDAARDAG